MANRAMLTLLILAAVSCHDSHQQSHAGNTKDAEPVIKDDTAKDVIPRDTSTLYFGASDTTLEDVLPDSTINNKLILGNPQSFFDFYRGKNKVNLVEGLRETAVAIFDNRNHTEYLLASQYEGDSEYSFHSFEIGFKKNLPTQPAHTTREKRFRTESSIRLSLSLEDVESIKGKSYLKKVLSDTSYSITYRVNNMNSPFIQRYNTPGYFLEIMFVNDRSTRIFFGFDYP